jgi:glycerophosphoryl diester phosphodiesterase
VWTVDKESTMHDLLELGVDGIMTDRPRLLRDVLAARGLPLPHDEPVA